MPVTGAHMLVYTSQPEDVRRLLADVLGTRSVDAGDGWLIFGLPPAEIAVHPADGPSHEITLMCDDLETTMSELRDKGVRFEGEPVDEGWGVAVTMQLPGGLEMLLYEPRHPTAAG